MGNADSRLLAAAQEGELEVAQEVLREVGAAIVHCRDAVSAITKRTVSLLRAAANARAYRR
jgi:hypothetical protein